MNKIKFAQQKADKTRYRQFFLQALFLLGAVVITSSALANNKLFCAGAFTKQLSQKTPQFNLDPKIIFNRIKNAGIEASDLRMRIRFGDTADVTLYHKGRSIGWGELASKENQDAPGKIFIDFISIEEAYERKGLGILMYLGLAKAAYHDGQILGNSYNTSHDANRMWQSLVKSGLAYKTGNLGSSSIEFKPELLHSLEFQARVDQILVPLMPRSGDALSDN